MKLINLTDVEYEAMRKREIEISKDEFSFDRQLERYCAFLSNIDMQSKGESTDARSANAAFRITHIEG